MGRDISIVSLTDIIAQLALVNTRLDALAKAIVDSSTTSRTIKQFCQRNNLSLRQFYSLQAEGRGPRMMSVGSTGKRISDEAERDWIAAREADAEVQQG
jgi:hypothetical protein